MKIMQSDQESEEIIGTMQKRIEGEVQWLKESLRTKPPRGRCGAPCDICNQRPCMEKEDHRGGPPPNGRWENCRCAITKRGEDCLHSPLKKPKFIKQADEDELFGKQHGESTAGDKQAEQEEGKEEKVTTDCNDAEKKLRRMREKTKS